MNKLLVRKIYMKAHNKCVADGDASTWKFETEYAKAILNEVLEICESVERFGEQPVAEEIRKHFGLI